MDGFLAQLARRLRIPDADVITGDEVRNWPDGRLGELLTGGILQEVEHGTTVVCDQCDEHCSIEPELRTDPQTGRAVGVHVCLREEVGGRFEIALDRLRRWRISKRKLAQMGYREGKAGSSAGQSREAKRATEKTQLISALLAHHGFSDEMLDEELNMTPATQKALAKTLKWGQEKVSRVVERAFPDGFWAQYRRACKADVLQGFLKQLEDASTAVESVYYRPQHPTEREERDADHCD
ncbi:MAG: hypothetical protein NTZ17_00805 [Phycisphaerae bacterium]|nr:hypothetical protein [Phycisphaerae bacterium]